MVIIHTRLFALIFLIGYLAPAAMGQTVPVKDGGKRNSAEPLQLAQSGGQKVWTDREQLVEMVRTWQAAKSSHPAMEAVYARMPVSDRPALVRDLIPKLSATNWNEQANAAFVLGLLGPLAAPAVHEMVAALDARMDNVSEAVAQSLVKIGPDTAVPELAKALPPAGGVNLHEWHVMKCLAELGPEAAAAAPAVVPYLDNGANTGAQKALAKMGSAVIPAICKGLASGPGRSAPHYASEVLQSFGAATCQPLADALKGADANGRKNIAATFSFLKPPAINVKAAPVLCHMLQDGDPSVRESAKRALIAIGPSAAPDVAEYLKDENPDAAQAAQTILGIYGPGAHSVLPALQSGIGSEDPRAQAQSAATILKIDANNCAAAKKLVDMLAGENVVTRRVAAEACGSVGANGAKLVPALIQSLHDRDPHVRLAAASAFGSIGPAAKAAVPALIQAATSTHPPADYGRELIGMDDSIQRAALESLGKIGPQASPAIKMLTDILANDRRSNLHQCACAALQAMGHSAAPAVPALIPLLAASNSGNFHEYATILEAIGPDARAALPALRDKLGAGDARSRRAAIEAIIAIDTGNQKRSDIQRLANDPDYSLRELAVKHLASDPATASANVPMFLSQLKGNNYSLRLLAIVGLGNAGPAAAEALPILIDENIGSSYETKKRELAFDAIKKIDPTGAKTIPILQEPLKDCFKVRSSVELLEHIGAPQCLVIARQTREHWKLK